MNTACPHCTFERPHKQNGFAQGHTARWVEEKGTEIRFSIILCHFCKIQKLRYFTKQNYNYLEKDAMILLRGSDSLCSMIVLIVVLVNKENKHL